MEINFSIHQNNIELHSGCHDDSQFKEVFVGGLSPDIEEPDIHFLFQQFGTINNIRLMRYRDGRSRGFAFATFDTFQSAMKAASISKIVVQGKVVEVKPAFKKSESVGEDTKENERKVIVEGLSPQTDQTDLKNYFQYFGVVLKARIIHDPVTHCPKGLGYVVFSSQAEATSVLSYNKNTHYIDGREVLCKQQLASSLNNKEFGSLFHLGTKKNSLEIETENCSTKIAMLLSISNKERSRHNKDEQNIQMRLNRPIEPNNNIQFDQSTIEVSNQKFNKRREDKNQCTHIKRGIMQSQSIFHHTTWSNDKSRCTHNRAFI